MDLPSTKCIAAQPTSPHAHQAPNLATGTLEHSFRWLAGLWRSGNTGRTHVDLLAIFAIHEMYSSPSTLAACTPSPVSCYWHPRVQLQVVGRAVVQWQHGADPCGPYSRDTPIHEMYSSPATLAACTSSPISSLWHPRAQLQVVGRAVLQWQQGAGLCGPIGETYPSTKCIAAHPPSPHAH
jgi:hypothetical protein